MQKFFLLSQKGFSIIQGMFLAGAVAGMAYVGTKLTTDQKLMQKGIEAKNRVEQLHDMIYSVLQNRDHCATTLSLNNLTTAANLSNTGAQTLTGIATAGTAALSAAAFKTNSSASYDPALVYMNNTVSIKNMAITYPSNFANAATLSLTYARLEDTNSARRTGKGTGTKEITKKISLKIQRGGSGEFKSCYAVTSLENEDMIKDFCEDMGADGNDATPSLFTWNASLQTCQLRDLKCPSGFVYAGFDSNGNPRCNRLENWMNLGEILDATPVDCFGKIASLEVVGQKIRIKCVTPPVGPCTPAISCPTIAAGVCSTLDAGSDSCGNPCGMGTKTCPTCTPEKSCDTLKNETCSWEEVSDSCGEYCGWGYLNCCTPTPACPAPHIPDYSYSSEYENTWSSQWPSDPTKTSIFHESSDPYSMMCIYKLRNHVNCEETKYCEYIDSDPYNDGLDCPEP